MNLIPRVTALESLTAGVAGVTSPKLLHGQETDVFADAGYRGVDKREEIQTQHPNVRWHVAMMPGKRKTLDKGSLMGALLDALETTKARIRATAKPRKAR